MRYLSTIYLHPKISLSTTRHDAQKIFEFHRQQSVAQLPICRRGVGIVFGVVLLVDSQDTPGLRRRLPRMVVTACGYVYCIYNYIYIIIYLYNYILYIIIIDYIYIYIYTRTKSFKIWVALLYYTFQES